MADADPFAALGAVADTTPEPDPFAALGAQAETPHEAGQDYLQKLNLGQEALASDGDTHYAKAPGYWDSYAIWRMLSAMGGGLFGKADPGTEDTENAPIIPNIPVVGGAVAGAMSHVPIVSALARATPDDLRKAPFGVGPFVGSFMANMGHGIGNLAAAADDKAGRIKDEIYNKTLEDAQGPGAAAVQAGLESGQGYDPFGASSSLSPLPVAAPSSAGRITSALTTGTVKSGVGLADTAAALGEKATDIFPGDVVRAMGFTQAAGRAAANVDYARRKAEQMAGPAAAAMTNLSGLPELESGVQNIAPFLLPGVAPFASAETAANIGAKLGDLTAAGITKAAPLTGKIVGGVAGGIGAGEAIPVFGHAAGLIGAKYGWDLGGKLGNLAAKTGPAVGGLVGDMTTLGINGLSPTATGLLYGVAGAQSGDEEQGARQGAAMGSLFSPTSMLLGAITRQRLEQAKPTSKAFADGLPSYGLSPEDDAQHAAAMATLAPQNSAIVNTARGWTRRITLGPDGTPIQIYLKTPEDYGPAALKEGQGNNLVGDPTGSRGFYRNGQGKIVINAAHPDVPGALNEALNHEGAHALLQDALPNVNPALFGKLSQAVTDSSLDPANNHQPTPTFQRLIDSYTGKPTDWNSLSGDSQAALLREIGAQTGGAINAAQNYGKLALKPEFSDHLAAIGSRFLQATGLKSGPDISAILPGSDPNNPVPADPAALRLATKAYREMAQKANADVSPVQQYAPLDQTAPVEPAQPPPSTPAAPPQAQTQPPVPTSTMQPPNRGTDAYRNAYDLLTTGAVGKKYTAKEATSLLDAAASRSDVPDALESYLFYAKTGNAPRPITADAAGPTQGPVVLPSEQPAAPASQPITLPTHQQTEPVSQQTAPQSGATTATETAVAPQNVPRGTIPLSAADIARIEAQTEANFVYAGPKPRKSMLAANPNIVQERAATALQAAKLNAVADAHAAALPEGDRRVQMRVDPDTGARTISGKHFVEDDPFHQRFLNPIQFGERSSIKNAEVAIENGDLLNFDYDSAKEVRSQQTQAQRKESQVASPAMERVTGVGAIQEANKALRPTHFSVSQDGSINLHGYSPDKLLGNAENVMKVLHDNDMADRLPYENVNDPLFTQDVGDYIRNQANGRSGDGTRKLTATDAVSVPAGDPAYQPVVLPPERANVMNLIMGQQPTLSERQVVTSTGLPSKSAELRNFAAANDNPPSESGEVNPLRDELNRKGLLKVNEDTGSKQLLHSVFENVKPALMSNFSDPAAAPEFTNLRAAPFRGDRRVLAPEGRVPNSAFSGAGFLPSSPTNPMFDAAVQNHGTTNRIEEAGYILPDGRLLDFSGRRYAVGYTNGVPNPGQSDYLRGQRNDDHRQIDFGQGEGMDRGAMMNRFIDAGAIRVDAASGLIDASKEPTPQQERQIAAVIKASDGSATLDLRNGDQADGTYSMSGTATPSKVLDAIRDFYQKGKPLPPPSRFLPAKEPAVQSQDNFTRWFGQSSVTNPDGTPKVVYHGGNGPVEDFSRGTNRGVLGPAYFTDNKQAAWRYALGGGIDDSLNLAGYRRKQLELTPQRQPTVTPVHLSMQNPLDFTDVLKRPEFEDALDTLGAKRVLDLIDKESPSTYQEIEQQYENAVGDSEGAPPIDQWVRNNFSTVEDHFRDWHVEHDASSLAGTPVLRFLAAAVDGKTGRTLLQDYMDAKGYDGVIFHDAEAGGKTYVPQRPEQIKSAAQNSGAYNPIDSRINYLLGNALPSQSSTGEPYRFTLPAVPYEDRKRALVLAK